MNPLSPGTHEFDVDGLPQRYYVYGEGPVCLVQPGGPGIFWEAMRIPVAERHLTMVYIEPLGTGRSGRLPTHPHGYSRSRYAHAIDRLIARLDVGDICLLGHSYGGFVAQRYALEFPGRLTGLVLYDSASTTGEEHAAETARRVKEFAISNRGNPELPAVLAALQSVGSITDDDELTAALRGLLPAYLADYWGRRDEYAPLVESVRVNYISGLDADLRPEIIDDRPALPALAVPTLVIAGRFDVICGVRWAQELHELIPNSRLSILEKSGHLGHLEEAENFASALVEFVRSTAVADQQS